jgi:hypothetical protein
MITMAASAPLQRRIGILTTNASLFSSGMVQNAYFLYRVFTNLGYACDMLSYDPSFKQLNYTDTPVRTISENRTVFRPEDYALLITVSVGVRPTIYEACKKVGTRVIGFTCGNVACMNVEAFVSETRSSSTIIGKENPVDSIWLIQCFEFMKSYLSLARRTTVECVPHLWNPCLLEEHAKKRGKTHADLVYNPAIHTNPRSILIMLEPNLQFVKTAVVPIMGAEKLNRTHPDCIELVQVYNYPTKSAAADALADTLTLGTKLRKNKSPNTTEVLLVHNSISYMPIFVSHQIYTEWNYLYYELLYYGYPLVHNSPALRDYGYYYEGFDVDACAEQIHTALRTHNVGHAETLAKNRAFLATIDPDAEACKAVWRDLLHGVAPTL